MDARLANVIFSNAPGVVLATSEALANVELEFDEGTTAVERAELLEEFLVNFLVNLGSATSRTHSIVCGSTWTWASTLLTPVLCLRASSDWLGDRLWPADLRR